VIAKRTTVGDTSLSLPLAKEHLRVDYVDENGLITSLTQAAHNMASEMTGLVLTEEVWEVSTPPVSGDFVLPVMPVKTVDAISYFDANDVSQTAEVENFYFFANPTRPVLRPKPGFSWPNASKRDDAITVTVTAGLEAVPDEILAAIKLIVGHLYENREAVVEGKHVPLPWAVETMLDLHRAKWATA